MHPGKPPLSPGKRRRLNALFLQETLEAVQASRMVNGIHAICHSRSLLAVARRQGVEAVPAGAEAVAPQLPSSQGASLTLHMAGLLPLLEAQDVAFLVGRALDGPRDVVVTPPHRREATILLGPDGDLSGDGLRSPAERRKAPGRGWELYRMEAALEVWEPDDLDRVLRSPRTSRGKESLRSWLRRSRPPGRG